LPVGIAGKGLLLLSGGIDSPVAGYLMASRGMRLDAIYFHAYPYTSKQAQEKVVTLASILSTYTLGIQLHTIPFTEVQVCIKEKASDPWMTVLLRMAMMECASKLSFHIGTRCLITGESLSQVASQTVENIRCTESRARIPVFRPLIGLDKEETINLARKIGTYTTSILPYPDCCVLFSPLHPVLHASLEEATQRYTSLELDSLIDKSLHDHEIHYCSPIKETPYCSGEKKPEASLPERS
jgi:thiamine biosynthesis protein ThiI